MMRTAVLARARSVPSDNDPLPLPTPAAIAATVRYGARAQAAEAELAAARRRRDEIAEEARALSGRLANPNKWPDARDQMLALQSEREGLDARIRELRPSVREARTERAGRVAEALRSVSAEAASA